MTKRALGDAYGRPLEMEVEGEFFPDYSVEWIEQHRKAQVGRVITQEGPFKGGLVLSYEGGLHQVAYMDGEIHTLVWIWSKKCNNDPVGVSSAGWQNKGVKEDE